MESYQLLLLRHKAVYLFTLCVWGGGVYMCMEMLMCMGTCGGQRSKDIH